MCKLITKFSQRTNSSNKLKTEFFTQSNRNVKALFQRIKISMSRGHGHSSILFDAEVHFPLNGLFDWIDFLQYCRHCIDELIT